MTECWNMPVIFNLEAIIKFLEIENEKREKAKKKLLDEKSIPKLFKLQCSKYVREAGKCTYTITGAEENVDEMRMAIEEVYKKAKKK
jgi:hypothetical protein